MLKKQSEKIWKVQKMLEKKSECSENVFKYQKVQKMPAKHLECQENARKKF